MRKSLWIGALAAALIGGLGYWYFTATTPGTIQVVEITKQIKVEDKHDGDAELSEPVEPLHVDGGQPVGAPTSEPPLDDGPMPRVVLEPGMVQPPRPDAQPGTQLRMPYADEDNLFGLIRYSDLRIGVRGEPMLDIFKDLDKATPAEESESTEPSAPIEPLPRMPDYHHGRCPYHGGCPAPYYPRTIPRD